MKRVGYSGARTRHLTLNMFMCTMSKDGDHTPITIVIICTETKVTNYHVPRAQRATSLPFPSRQRFHHYNFRQDLRPPCQSCHRHWSSQAPLEDLRAYSPVSRAPAGVATEYHLYNCGRQLSQSTLYGSHGRMDRCDAVTV